MCRPVMTLLPGGGQQAQRQGNSKEPRPASSTCSSFSDVEYSSSDDFDDSLEEPLHSSSWQQLRYSETAAFRAAGSRFSSTRPLPALQQAEPELPPGTDSTDDAVMAILAAALQHQQLNADNSSSAAAATAAAAAAIGTDSLLGLLSLPLPAFDNPPVHRCLFDGGAAGARTACGAACNSSGIAAKAAHRPSSLPSSLSSGDDSDSEGGRVQQWLVSLETQGKRKRARGGSADDSPAAEPSSTGSPAWTVGGLSPPGFSVLCLLGQPSGLLQP